MINWRKTEWKLFFNEEALIIFCKDFNEKSLNCWIKPINPPNYPAIMTGYKMSGQPVWISDKALEEEVREEEEEEEPGILQGMMNKVWDWYYASN